MIYEEWEILELVNHLGEFVKSSDKVRVVRRIRRRMSF